MLLRVASAVAILAFVACAADAPDAHDEASDFDPVAWSGGGKADLGGIPAQFDRNTILSDALFSAADAVDGDGVQAFLEHSPYGTRSWLADERFGTQRFADALVDIATSHNIDPVLLLARMQAESSLVSATVRPSKSRTDIALGCGCPDSASCSPAYRGLANQLACAADVLVGRFGDAAARTGSWQVGVNRKTLDGYLVRPTTNATAALYAYTPWVLPGRGGTWLVWNVTRRFLKGFDDAGKLRLP
jgi:hypothetical protein